MNFISDCVFKIRSNQRSAFIAPALQGCTFRAKRSPVRITAPIGLDAFFTKNSLVAFGAIVRHDVVVRGGPAFQTSRVRRIANGTYPMVANSCDPHPISGFSAALVRKMEEILPTLGTQDRLALFRTFTIARARYARVVWIIPERRRFNAFVTFVAPLPIGFAFFRWGTIRQRHVRFLEGKL